MVSLSPSPPAGDGHRLLELVDGPAKTAGWRRSWDPAARWGHGGRLRTRCKKLYGCEYCIQDDTGNCIPEASCASGCAEDATAHPVAACINKAADCAAVGVCVSG